MVHEETGPSEANLFSGKFIIDPNKAPSKEVKSIGSLQLLVNPHGQPKKIIFYSCNHPSLLFCPIFGKLYHR